MNKNLCVCVFFFNQAYCYHGQTLLASDKCGEAIRSLQEAEKCKYPTRILTPLLKTNVLSERGIGS